jgi:signal peptide peptidase SppA
MKTLDIINSPWAIREDILTEIIAVYRGYLSGEKIDFQALGMPKMDSKSTDYSVINGNAVIKIKGPITKGNSFFSFFFEGASSEFVKRDFDAAMADPEVDQIILDIDSPGGTVDGSFELADHIFQARGEKPIIAFSSGTIASAAYLIAASADKIYITGKTNHVGSIGVIATHVDFSKHNEQMGETITEIVSGRYKNIASSENPLSEEGKAEIQAQVDYIFSIFANDVAERREIDLKTIVDLEAKVLIGQQSIEAGLADGDRTMDQLLTTGESIQTKEEFMDINELKEKYPQTYAEALEAGMKDGAEQERQRIVKIKEMTIPGREDLAEKCIAEGLSWSESAERMIMAEKGEKAAFKEASEKDFQKPVEVEEQPDVEEEKPEATFEELVQARIDETKCKRSEAIKHCAKNHPAEHAAYIKR